MLPHNRKVVSVIAVVAGLALMNPVQAASVSIDPPNVPIVVSTSELQLVVTIDRAVVSPPTTAQLTFVVKNIGTTTATDVAIQNVLPVGFTYSGSNPTDLTNLGQLAPGASLSRTYPISIPSTVKTNRYVIEAIVSATNAESVESTVAIDVNNGQVLGTSDEALAVTGSSPLLLNLLGFVLMSVGILRFRRG